MMQQPVMVCSLMVDGQGPKGREGLKDGGWTRFFGFVFVWKSDTHFAVLIEWQGVMKF